MIYLGLVKTAQDLISERGHITAIELSMKLTEEAYKADMTFSLQDFDDTIMAVLSDPVYKRQEYCTKATAAYRTKELFYYWPR